MPPTGVFAFQNYDPKVVMKAHSILRRKNMSFSHTYESSHFELFIFVNGKLVGTPVSNLFSATKLLVSFCLRNQVTFEYFQIIQDSCS